MKKPTTATIIITIIILLTIFSGAIAIRIVSGTTKETSKSFDGTKALEDVKYQVELGPRTVGSNGHAQIVSWITDELRTSGWEVEIQSSTLLGHPIQNIVARRGQGNPWIILGAHYDTRMVADRDPDPQKRNLPVPGADDGASGVAVLLGIARTLPSQLDKQVWLVFFDAEDDGNIPGWDWILGSTAFVQGLNNKPQAAIIVDMVGDANLNIYMEQNSNLSLETEIWAQAAKLGYHQFIPLPKYSIEDDHTPFIQKGIPAVDIIDFDYPYYHTTADTPDKVSAESLKAVGDTLLAWLNSR